VSPDKVQARKMVLVGVLLLAIIAVYRNHQRANPADTFRVVWAVGVVGLLLSLLADFAPKIAGPFAILTVLGALTENGEKALHSVLGSVGAAPAQPAASGSGSSARSGTSPTTPAPRPAPAPAPAPAGG
jgi:hypothetical protein